jgi:hypothetical protein
MRALHEKNSILICFPAFFLIFQLLKADVMTRIHACHADKIISIVPKLITYYDRNSVLFQCV